MKTANSNVTQSAKVIEFPVRKAENDMAIRKDGKLIQFPIRKVKEVAQPNRTVQSLKMAA